MSPGNPAVLFLALFILLAPTSGLSGQEQNSPKGSTPDETGVKAVREQTATSGQQAGKPASNADPFADLRAELPRPIRDKNHSVPSATDFIEEALDAQLKSPLSFENQPLREVMAHIAQEYSLPIVVDVTKFEEVAMDPDASVAIDLKCGTLRSSLNLLLHQPGLEDASFAVINDVLIITTKEYCAESMYVRVYPTEDFVYSNAIEMPHGASAWADYSPLVHVITNCVAPETWEENGTGQGEIDHIKPGLLIVYQEYRVHVEIENLFTAMRQELRVMEQQLGRDALRETGLLFNQRQGIQRTRERGTLRGGISAQ